MRRHIVHPVFSRLAPFALCLLAGCGGGAEGTGGTGSSTTGSGATEPLTCTVPEVAQARPIAPLLIPGCSFTGGSSSTPTILHTAEEVSAALRCSGEGQPPAGALGIDMAANDVYLLEYTMSPAFGGLEVFDDGTALTLVTRFRPNCPGDPMPMPMNSTLAWLMPKDASRTVQQASCSLPERCD
jgi:hypothetical protein